MHRRIAIVTGAGMGAGGIGRGIAARLVQDGLQVMLADIDAHVREAAAMLPQQDVDCFVGDLAQETDARLLVERTLARFGRIDVLVNNAGGGVIRPFLEHDAASLQKTLERNLWTTLWCCHKVLPHMVAQGHGRIVNIGADSLRTGIPNHAAYNAAKGGVLGLTVGLARDWAHLDITVNMVSPCVVQTEHFRGEQRAEPAVAAAFLAVVPKGRPAAITEIADLVAFLARPEAAFMTGQNLSINGASAMP